MNARPAGWTLCLVLASGGAWAEPPHAHGVARLDLSVEGRRLSLDFAAPLEDIVGFERRPANDKERAAFEAAAAYFKGGRALVASLPANCRMADATAGIEERGKGHFEFVARLAYDCKEPQELRQVEAALLGPYRRVKRIDVRAATAKGQSSGRLAPGKGTFAF